MKSKLRYCIPALIVISAVLFVVSCDLETGDYKSFDYNLRGTWVSNDPSRYSGKLVIGFDTIKITGYNESQTPSFGNDSERPFKGILKGVFLKGYSEEGRIYIENNGEGIPYEIKTAGTQQQKFLYFKFGDRNEILQKSLEDTP
jgi:hypothetical protein